MHTHVDTTFTRTSCWILQPCMHVHDFGRCVSQLPSKYDITRSRFRNKVWKLRSQILILFCQTNIPLIQGFKTDFSRLISLLVRREKGYRLLFTHVQYMPVRHLLNYCMTSSLWHVHVLGPGNRSEGKSSHQYVNKNNVMLLFQTGSFQQHRQFARGERN